MVVKLDEPKDSSVSQNATLLITQWAFVTTITFVSKDVQVPLKWICYCITKTRLYNFDPLKPHFYIIKLGFTGVYIIFLISA